jgi:excisionase family DNA binding protein
MPTPEVLTINEVAERLRIHPRTAYRLVNDGSIPGVRVGRQYRISAKALDAYIEGRHPVPTAVPAPTRRRSA